MSFESLSEYYEFVIPDFPPEWLPLIYLYDPDLPLYPLLYFHCLDPNLSEGTRPGERDRVFGFVHHINLEQNQLRVTVALNKNLSNPSNSHYRQVVERVVLARLGYAEKITLSDISEALTGKLKPANKLLVELWYQIVDGSFGKSLPFGKLWDPVLGLVRFIASWNSDGGRKGELIQTHYFSASFGEKIATGSGVHVDFYLLPTFEEFAEQQNPLSIFPKFRQLVIAASAFCDKYCSIRVVDTDLKFSAFELTLADVGSVLKTETVLAIIGKETGKIREALFENYNSFNRGPQRSIISLMMINDLRLGNWHPSSFSPNACALIYEKLGRSYQTPKVIQLYAQQCFGSKSVLPIDIWIKTFLRWPLGLPLAAKSKWHKEVFASSQVWGKVERLIWLAAQSRKVHSSVSAEILWCIRYGDPEGDMRGANPMACKICQEHIRDKCPAYATIENSLISFNSPTENSAAFKIRTSAGNNSTALQTFIQCSGPDIVDEYSARDRADSFQPFPASTHTGECLSVSEFIKLY